MGAMASQITNLAIVYSTVYSGSDQRKHQSSASLAFVRGTHRWPVNSPHKGPVMLKMFPFDDVIMVTRGANLTNENKVLGRWIPNICVSQFHFYKIQHHKITISTAYSNMLFIWYSVVFYHKPAGLFSRNVRNVFSVSIILPYWDKSYSWNISLWNTRIRSFYKSNTMAGDARSQDISSHGID